VFLSPQDFVSNSEVPFFLHHVSYRGYRMEGFVQKQHTKRRGNPDKMGYITALFITNPATTIQT